MILEKKLIKIKTDGRGTYDITASINELIRTGGIAEGICHLFLQHTSASLILCENYDPQVRVDLEQFFASLVPDGDLRFGHTSEGKDDMPAHIRTILTQNSLEIPLQQQQLALGRWQGVYLYEHRLKPHERQLIITSIGMP
ncbi:MAG: secondary thiamine-phosphate synthase [Legionella sp. 40-6]|nr:YjbQ family protein [Legionella sp.]OJY35799.1 MAG: secondary thiamine-phosphate synthase [Legionella sp. 40-6]